MVGGRGPTGDSLPVKQFYQHTFIDYLEMMNAPVFPAFAARFGVTSVAVRRANPDFLSRTAH
jgi:hypothetical protein